MNEIADILERAADLIEPEGAWIQGSMAEDTRGRDVTDGYDPDAVCWCGLGAIECVTGKDVIVSREDNAATRAAAFLTSILGKRFDEWQDEEGRTQAEVVAKLREAAAKARGDQS